MEVTTSTNIHIHAHTMSPAVNQPTSQPLHQSVSLHQASRDFEHCKKQVHSLSATTAPTVRATFRGNLRTQWMWSQIPNLAAQLWKASVSHILKGFLEVETSEFFEFKWQLQVQMMLPFRGRWRLHPQGPVVWHVSQLPTSYSWGTEDLQLVRQILQQQVQLSITLALRNNDDVELNGMNQTGRNHWLE